MKIPDLSDTIAAISTPIGEGGIGIVRLSGEQALAIAGRVFEPDRGDGPPSTMATHTVHHGRVMDGDEVVDEVLLTVMHAPRSYTREDVVEIGCHGGVVTVRRVLELALAHGARLAEPGEFTKRAFLNGRFDLAQAEAVADIIAAKTEAGQRAAEVQLRGDLSREVNEIRERLADLLTYVEASIDFVEEDIELLSRDEMRERCEAIGARLQELIATAAAGQVLREGITAAIVGRANVGKSSLMNALLRTDRVIVTPVPGTTRDVVQETLNIKGIPMRVADTAGMRKSEDVVEAEGVTRSRQQMAAADIVLAVLDRSEPLAEDDRELLASIPPGRSLVVLNKSDLPRALPQEDLPDACGDVRMVETSATERTGLEELEDAITELVLGGAVLRTDGVVVTNARHKDALIRADDSMRRALSAIEEELSEEFIASDLRGALDAVGEVVGETLTEDIIERIFATFCIGK
ncbi:MAG: tRNA uridine-5-carboxymethylaminomethyl(34) synthesis GTPase MnmE [Armatimonadota bacterium]